MYTEKDMEAVWELIGQGMRDHFKNDTSWLKKTGPDQGDLVKTNAERFHPGGSHFMVEVATSNGNNVQWTIHSDGFKVCGMLANFNGTPSTELTPPDESWEGEVTPGQEIAGQRATVTLTLTLFESSP